MSYKKIILVLMLVLMCANVVSADAVDTMEENLSLSIHDIIMLIITCASLIVVALDARIALMFALMLYTSVFILFTLVTEEGIAGFNPYFSGTAMMLCFVVLCLSLLITYKKGNTPYNVV